LVLNNKEKIIRICEAVDQVLTLPFHGRQTVNGADLIKEIYGGFRRLTIQPLILSCLERLMGTEVKGRTVFLVTGAAGKYFIPEIGETDGPLGTAVLARTFARGLKALPVILTDVEQVDALKLILQSIGLTITDIRKGEKDLKLSENPNSVVVMSFPKSHNKAKTEAAHLVSSLIPAVAVSIERSGFNPKGHYHTSNGIVVDWKAKLDYIFQRCQAERVLTIGIGDGGNEIGMGKIFDLLSKIHKFGMTCQCPCKSGVISVTETDCTIVSTVANWGAYALSNAVAAYLDRRDLFHLPSAEEALLNTAIKAGFVDAKSGFGIPSVDGVSLEPDLCVVHLLKCLAEQSV
jgi:D-glutamate cyclase